MKKYYVFRPYGQDEGFVALLTVAQYEQIQTRLDDMIGDDPAFYIYPMDSVTHRGINKILDEHEAGLNEDSHKNSIFDRPREDGIPLSKGKSRKAGAGK